MCLLGIVPKKSDRQEITTAWLRDVYERNSDGFGFAWSTPSGGVHTFKSIGKFREFKKAWREMERHSGEFAFHLRMKTHGEISKEMAHPYPVGETGLHLMHNGVLACGNAGDHTKSDTWHYINDVVLPLYEKLGDGLFTPQLLEMMGQAIGNNRFVIVDKQGGLHVVNRRQGVTWNGMWLSNTYAWSAAKFGFHRGASQHASGRNLMALDLDDEEDDDRFDWRSWSDWSKQGRKLAEQNRKRAVYRAPTDTRVGTSGREKQSAVVGTLLGKGGKPVKVDIDEPAPAGGVGNPAYDFIQMLYTLGYTKAANELSQRDVEEYITTFGEGALEETSVEVCDLTWGDDDIIDEIRMTYAEADPGDAMSDPLSLSDLDEGDEADEEAALNNWFIEQRRTQQLLDLVGNY